MRGPGEALKPAWMLETSFLEEGELLLWGEEGPL